MAHEPSELPKNTARLLKRWPDACRLLILGSLLWCDASGMESVIFFLAVLAALFLLGVVALAAEFVPSTQVKLSPVAVGLLLAFGLLALSERPLLRFSFQYFKPQLEVLADMLVRGEKPRMPVRIGPFLIREAELRYQNDPALILDPNHGGPTSLVRSQTVPGNEWSHVRLSDQWLLFSED